MVHCFQVKHGKYHQQCTVSRKCYANCSLPEAQLILLPYASLLHAGTRAALGVSLERSVVIVDEAHNLIDTINEAHSVTLTARQLSEVSAQLAQYAERYHARLKPANRQCINQLLHVVRALRHSLVPPAGSNSNNGSAASAETPAALEKMVRMNAFQCSLNIDHINLFRLMAFCEGSSIAKKLRGFADAQAQATTTTTDTEAQTFIRDAIFDTLPTLGQLSTALAQRVKPDGCQ